MANPGRWGWGNLLKGRRVLVTGAGGFIGSHLIERLVRTGATVRAFVRYNSRQDRGSLRYVDPQVLSAVEVVAGDLRDGQAVEKAMDGVAFAFHLGAIISIPYSYTNPDEVVGVNVMGTLNVLNAARRHEVECLVHTSTSEVYGTARYVPIDEAHPLQGQSPYSASKIGADKLVESFWCAYGLPVVTIRPFNTYGPRQSTRAVIPTIITQALKADRIDLGNLEATRDFTFVSDTVEAFVKAVERPEARGQTVNLGTGREISIAQLCQMICRIVGGEIPVVVDKQRLRPAGSEVGRLLARNDLSAEVLGWTPVVSLEEGMARTVDWIRAHLADYPEADHYVI